MFLDSLNMSVMCVVNVSSAKYLYLISNSFPNFLVLNFICILFFICIILIYKKSLKKIHRKTSDAKVPSDIFLLKLYFYQVPMFILNLTSLYLQRCIHSHYSEIT